MLLGMSYRVSPQARNSQIRLFIELISFEAYSHCSIINLAHKVLVSRRKLATSTARSPCTTPVTRERNDKSKYSAK